MYLSVCVRVCVCLTVFAFLSCCSKGKGVHWMGSMGQLHTDRSLAFPESITPSARLHVLMSQWYWELTKQNKTNNCEMVSIKFSLIIWKIVALWWMLCLIRPPLYTRPHTELPRVIKEEPICCRNHTHKELNWVNVLRQRQSAPPRPISYQLEEIAPSKSIGSATQFLLFVLYTTTRDMKGGKKPHQDCDNVDFQHESKGFNRKHHINRSEFTAFICF